MSKQYFKGRGGGDEGAAAAAAAGGEGRRQAAGGRRQAARRRTCRFAREGPRAPRAPPGTPAWTHHAPLHPGAPTPVRPPPWSARYPPTPRTQTSTVRLRLTSRRTDPFLPPSHPNPHTLHTLAAMPALLQFAEQLMGDTCAALEESATRQLAPLGARARAGARTFVKRPQERDEN